MSDTVLKDFDWLRGRLNEHVKSGEWSYVLDLHDILDVLREQEEIVSPALDKHLRDRTTAMHKANAGNAAKDPMEIGFQGGVAGGVMYLIDQQGYNVEKARTLIANVMQIDRDDVVKWHKATLKAPDISDQNYRLNLNFAAQEMIRKLTERVSRIHNQMTVEDVILGVFSPT
ncbi:hypothetical protein [Ruegeria atlantica]|uniref:hypothetical protein n=1 Tax=Ruegeria atlantica TaxID=81569 RepID=UPI0024956A80|nr:hypothetical protein [Ruegeria atlantica]